MVSTNLISVQTRITFLNEPFPSCHAGGKEEEASSPSPGCAGSAGSRQPFPACTTSFLIKGDTDAVPGFAALFYLLRNAWSWKDALHQTSMIYTSVGRELSIPELASPASWHGVLPLPHPLLSAALSFPALPHHTLHPSDPFPCASSCLGSMALVGFAGLV